jgi:hypothetical protein
MPIHLNLLAESQAFEELRRRDPVKRAVWIGAFLIVAMLLWSSSLQLKAMMAKSELTRVEAQISTRSNAFEVVRVGQKKLQEVTQKLGKLRQLATNRFLNGTVLNALQQTTLDDVQLVRFRAEEKYDLIEATKPKTNSDERITPGRPASVTEKITLTLDARDGGLNPGDQVNKFKQTVSEDPYFKTSLGATNQVRLINLSPPQAGPEGKPFILFTLESRFSEKTR